MTNQQLLDYNHDLTFNDLCELLGTANPDLNAETPIDVISLLANTPIPPQPKYQLPQNPVDTLINAVYEQIFTNYVKSRKALIESYLKESRIAREQNIPTKNLAIIFENLDWLLRNQLNYNLESLKIAESKLRERKKIMKRTKEEINADISSYNAILDVDAIDGNLSETEFNQICESLHQCEQELLALAISEVLAKEKERLRKTSKVSQNSSQSDGTTSFVRRKKSDNGMEL